ncbi:MAG: hypothetical protein E6R08_06295 [Nevskiaceae bacterium]|nr:MAG: hypothetical protein E6R08_06295 [Nevskiaceae bacterium]
MSPIKKTGEWTINYANRAGLKAWGKIFGLRRRWFGLESEASFRRRLVDAMNSPDGRLNQKVPAPRACVPWRGAGTTKHKSGWPILPGYCVHCGRKVRE